MVHLQDLPSLIGKQFATGITFAWAVACGAAGTAKTTDHNPTSNDRNAGSYLVGRDGKVSTAYADGSDRGIETKVLPGLLSCLAGNAAGDTVQQFELDTGFRRILLVNVISGDARTAVGTQNQKTIVDGLQVGITIGAGSELVAFLDGMLQGNGPASDLHVTFDKDDAASFASLGQARG